MFLSGVRPSIGSDACFLKGPCRGQLFAAVGWDGNNQMYPITYAVAEAGCKESWTWFLHNLLQDNGPIEERGWTFMTDQQKVNIFMYSLCFEIFLSLCHS